MSTFLDSDFTSLTSFISENSFSKLFFLVDENTHHHCLPIVLGNLETEIPYEILEIEAGEEMKNIHTATQLWEILTEMQADRKALLINLGGGVITDMGGFVASTYKRGIRFINIPTTLLGMCDASIGGKTGIDLMNYKNMVGTFTFPEQIFVHLEFLKSLPFEELRSGFAEMLKHGLIADKRHWESLISLSALTPEAIFPHVPRSMEIKQHIVDIDFKEQNLRKTLNFGHTIGHAVESLYLAKGTPILHGEAVALGMIVETYLSYLESRISLETSESIIENIRKFYPYIDIASISDEEMLQFLWNDKKNENKSILFSLLINIGECTFDYSCTSSAIFEAVTYYRTI